MKKKSLIAVTLIAAFAITAFKIADDIISKLGMQQSLAQQSILNNLTGDFSDRFYEASFEESTDENAKPYVQLKHFKIPVASMLPSIIKGDKAGAAKELCAYIKMYFNSSDFIKDYNAKREKCKPSNEPPPVDKETIDMTRESVKATEQELASMKKSGGGNKISIQAMEEDVKMRKAQLAIWADPTPYKTSWEKQFPADPAVLIKKRLQDYLATVATVDFTASLKDEGGKRKFTNPVYESKSIKWKAIYRAGKEVNDVVTAFVKDWLKGDIIGAAKIAMPASDNAAAEKAADPQKTTTGQPIKEKKSLFNKVKKAAGVLKN
jgi:hypothetical protein